jgi:hypothetical protein
MDLIVTQQITWKSSELSEISHLNVKLSKKIEDSYFPLKGVQRKVHRNFYANYHSSGSAVAVPLEEHVALHILL